MENLLFSLNATLPIFFVIFAGWLLRRIGILGESFQDANTKLCFQILLPLMLFTDICETDISQMFSIKFLLFCVVSTLVCLLGIWGLAVLFCKDRDSIGSFVQGSMRGSAGILGVAFAENMYGNAGMVPLMIIAIVPVYNIGSVILLTMYSRERPPKGQVRSMLLSVLTNPLILGVLAGVPFALLHVDFPPLMDKCLNNLSVLTSPLALLLVGSGFALKQPPKQWKLSIIATLIKLLVLPAIFLPVAVWMGFREQALIAILIMMGAPSTVSGYIMAKSMHNNAELSCSIVVLTTLFSAVTVTGFIFLLRTMGYV